MKLILLIKYAMHISVASATQLLGNGIIFFTKEYKGNHLASFFFTFQPKEFQTREDNFLRNFPLLIIKSCFIERVNII
jgi:hypothetical protein